MRVCMFPGGEAVQLRLPLSVARREGPAWSRLPDHPISHAARYLLYGAAVGIASSVAGWALYALVNPNVGSWAPLWLWASSGLWLGARRAPFIGPVIAGAVAGGIFIEATAVAIQFGAYGGPPIELTDSETIWYTVFSSFLLFMETVGEMVVAFAVVSAGYLAGRLASSMIQRR